MSASPPPLFQGRVHELSGNRATRLVSIVLPVKNSASDLRSLLPRLLAQQTDRNMEIVAADSGSSDDTRDVLREYGATVLAIEPALFDYGGTRNLAARYTGGSVLVFVTTRSRPADNHWLANLVAPLDADPRIAAVSSRVLPRLDADILTARDQLRIRVPGRSVSEIGDWSRYRSLKPQALRQLISFPNVSAAIRADVFARISFPHMTFGEDMKWAREVLEAGLKIQYEPSSTVLHSHNYSPVEWFRRSFDDGGANWDVAGIRLDARDVIPTILSMVRDDWRYLELGWRLEGPELRHWQLRSVLRRTAWALGQWLGTDRRLLAGGLPALIAAARVMKGEDAKGEPYGEVFGRSFDPGASRISGPEPPADSQAMINRLIAALEAEWSQMEQQGDRTSDTLEAARVDIALRRIAESVGAWLGRHRHRFGGDLETDLSLIEQVKRGLVTSEMTGALPEQPAPGSRLPYPATDEHGTSITDGWQADTKAFSAALTAHEVELAALLSSAGARDRRIAELQAELHAKVGARDEIIRGLQSELHDKVAACNRVISSLQQELLTSVEQRDDIIRGLQSQLRTSFDNTDRPVADPGRSGGRQTEPPVPGRGRKPDGSGPRR
jgi:rhamnosyltransferase